VLDGRAVWTQKGGENAQGLIREKKKQVKVGRVRGGKKTFGNVVVKESPHKIRNHIDTRNHPTEWKDYL